MEKHEISEQLQVIFAKVFNEPGIIISDELTADNVNRWDSLSHLTMIAEVEKYFGIKFKLRELVGMKNTGELIELIYQKKQP